MFLRAGIVRGFKTNMSKLTGFETVSQFPSKELLSKVKQFETIRSCKEIKPQYEFCKEKIGLLNGDIFTKTLEQVK